MFYRRSLSLWLSCGLLVSAIALGSCTPSTPDPEPSPTPDTTATPLPSDDSDPGAETEPPVTPTAPATTPPSPALQPDTPVQASAAEVYWLDMESDGLELVPQPLNPTASEAGNAEVVLTTALETLLDGPQNAAHSTTIPPEARLRGIEVKADGVHVDLSADFTSGGGTTSMTGRVAQILYTATSLDPNMPVWLAVESEPLELLGGEGLMIRQPLTRQAFHEDFEL